MIADDPFAEERERLLKDAEQGREDLIEAVGELTAIAETQASEYLTIGRWLWMSGAFALGMWMGLHGGGGQNGR